MASRIVSYLSSAAGQDPRQDAIVLFADDFWTTIPLPTGQRIRLLHEFIRFETDYPWRPRDWSSWRLSDHSFSWGRARFRGSGLRPGPPSGLDGPGSWLSVCTGSQSG